MNTYSVGALYCKHCATYKGRIRHDSSNEIAYTLVRARVESIGYYKIKG